MKKVIYALILPLIVVSGLFANREIKKTAKIVFKSTDGGQTWQDISNGLPENLREDSIRGNSFFANDEGLFLSVGNGLYHSTPNATTPFWTKEISPASQPRYFGEHSRLDSVKSRISANNYWGVNLKTTNGTSVWSPMFDYSQEPRIRSTFETAGGTIFIGTDEGIFKTDNRGKTWKLVYTGGFVGHLAEANGVLLAIGMKRIIRSTDNGESWSRVISEDSVAFDVKLIRDGFAAITSNSETNTPNTSRLSTSYDGGKTWQPIDAGLQDKINSIARTWDDRPRVKAFQTSIIQVGENFFCTHPKGIFRSSDKGKTWKLLLPSVKDKPFNLFVSGNVIYAIPGKGGC
ncbi:MAG TPA: hypothetical protein VN726_13815 [Hanamia sp.]|nr:hypothetical protein [Hanamia sp.]